MMRLFVAALWLGRAASYDTGSQEIRSTSPWAFVERFCVGQGANSGHFEFEIKHRGGALLVYHGSTFRSSFPKMDKSTYTASILEDRYHQAQLKLPLVPRVDSDSGEYLETTTTTLEFDVETSSPQFVFVVLVNYDQTCNNGCDTAYCVNRELTLDCFGPVWMDYTMRATVGSGLVEEFSYAESALYPLAIAAFLAQTLLLLASLVVRRMLRVQRKLHHTARMLNKAVVLQWISSLVNLSYYATYASRGRASVSLLIFSRLLNAFADLETLILFLTLAHGWTVVRHKLTGKTRIWLAMLSTTYLIAFVTMQVWSAVTYDPSRVEFYFASAPGIAIAVLRIAALLDFLLACRSTMATFRKKHGFYRKFRVVGAMWIAELPFSLLVASFADDYWSQNAFTITHTIGFFAGQALLVAMYNPSTSYNKGFPFHNLTTAQLGMSNRQQQRRPSKLLISDAVERCHLERVASVTRALVNRVATLQHLSVEFHDALEMVEVPHDLQTELIRQPASRSSNGTPAASTHRTLLDAALDEELPGYSSARQRSSQPPSSARRSWTTNGQRPGRPEKKTMD